VLRATRKTVRKNRQADDALVMAIKAVRALDIPHLERFDGPYDEELIH